MKLTDDNREYIHDTLRLISDLTAHIEQSDGVITSDNITSNYYRKYDQLHDEYIRDKYDREKLNRLLSKTT